MKRGLSLGDIASVAADNGADNGVYTQVRSKRNKPSKKTCTVQSQINVNSTVDRATSSVISQLSPGTQPSVSQQRDEAVSNAASAETLEVMNLKTTITELTNEVQSCKIIINKLSTQLDFILGYLDINKENINDHEQAETSTVADMSSVEADAPPASQQAQPSSWAAVARAGVAAAGVERDNVRRPTTLRDAVATAVCADQRDRERRAKSVVVSGLAPSPDSDDATNFRRLCMFEFGIDIQVIHARRLGLGGDSGDRIRPLLIGLQSAEDADLLMKKAKLLRRSTDESVRNTVFINRNLSKIGARLAYEERCRRRHRLAIQADPAVRSQLNEAYQGQSSTGRLVINSRFHHDRLHNNTYDINSSRNAAVVCRSPDASRQSRQPVDRGGPSTDNVPSTLPTASSVAAPPAAGRHR